MNKLIDKLLDAFLHPATTFGMGYAFGVVMSKVLS